MGLSLVGSLLWVAGLLGSLLWPALIAIGVARLRRPPIRAPGRFLAVAIPVSYLIVLGTHSVLADTILLGAKRAAETGMISMVWWRIVVVLGFETALAASVIFWLAHRMDAAGRRP
jgi:hypothetical protein